MMEKKRVDSTMRFLHLEQEDQDAIRIRNAIYKVWSHCVIDHIKSLEGFQQNIQQHQYALIMTDQNLPIYDAVRIVMIVKQIDPAIPIILVTENLDEQTSLDYLAKGIMDYVIKPNLNRLIPAIQQALYIRELKNQIEKERKAALANKRLFHQVIDLIPHNIFAKDKNGRILFLNQTSATNYDMTPNQAAGTLESEITKYPEEAKNFIKENQEIIQRGDIQFNPDSKYTDNKGNIHYQQTYKIPFVPEGSNEKAILGISIDITDLKVLEQKLLNANAFYSSLVQTIPQIILCKDLNGVITFVNQTGCNVFGKTFNELVGKTDFELFPDELARKYTNDDKRLIETREVIDVIENTMNEDGTYYIVHTIKSPILDELNNMVGIQIISWDITKQIENEERIKQGELFIRAILDSISSNIAIINEEGTIIHVNQAWKNFAVQNCIANADQINYFEGISYLDLCRSIAEKNVEESEDAKAVFDGIRDVLSGKHDCFLYQYPCHSPAEKRWFQMRVTRLKLGSENQLVLAHDNITEQKLHELELKERTLAAELGYTISKFISGSNEMQSMLQNCTELLVKHLDAAFARIWLVNETEHILELKASAGMYTHLNGEHGRVPIGKFKIGLIAQEKKPHLTNSVIGDPQVGNQDWAIKEGMVSFAGYPIMLGDRLFGVMALFAKRSLSDVVLRMLQSVANVIALGMNRIITEEQLRDEQKNSEMESIQRAKLEMSIHSQIQKMEAVRQLASGIAHDFNNFHWIIKSNTQFMMDKIEPGSDLYKDASEILMTVDRASVLTKELNMLSKKQLSDPKPLNINQAVISLTHSIEQIAGAKIRIQVKLHPEIHSINIDSSDFEQVVINIIINACEAMQSGGELILSTSNYVNREKKLFHLNSSPTNSFVCLAIKDSGTGMDEETQSKMYNPFFTTKVAGKGTGLGLSIVHNIVVQNGGFICVKSNPGSGTEFQIYFPTLQENKDV